MATKIVTKNSSTASAVPTASDLVQGELAVNVADKRLFTEDNSGAIVELGTNPSSLTVSGNIDVDGVTNLDAVDIDGAVDMASTLTVAGEITANGGIAFGDNDKATFGDSDDLQIYHDGSNSYIRETGTGNLNISADQLRVLNAGNNEIKAAFTTDGAVDLYHNNALKLATTSTGIDVTGTATMDGLTVDGDSTVDAITYTTSSSFPTTGVTLNTNGFSYEMAGTQGKIFRSSGNSKALMQITNDGDISFYEDTGTTPKLFWDASAESLQLSGNGLDISAGTGDSQLRVVTGSGDAGIELNAGNSQPWYIYNGVNDFHIRSDDTDYLTIDTSGRVGIGTSSPDTLLEVVGADPILTVRDTETSGASSNATLRLAESGASDTLNNYWDINHTGGSALRFVSKIGVTTTERMRIDSSGNVNIYGTDNRPLAITSFDTVSTGAGWDLDATSSNGVVTVSTSGTERLRIDSSGNLLVGTTNATIYASGTGGATGVLLDPNGPTAVARDSGTVMYLNRLTSDGEIAVLRKNGSTVGSIGTTSGRLIVNSQNSTGYLSLNGTEYYRWKTTAFIPHTDNSRDLGESGTRWDDVYATNGTINTSDRNEKQDIAELSEAEQRVAVACKGLLRKFRWKDSVAEKGDDARIHFGIIAQDLQAAFEAEGLDAGDYAMFISTTWTDEETNEEKTRMGVRYSELLAFIISAI